MEDVAKGAGVSRLIVYRIFDSKADVYRAVLQDLLTELGERFMNVDMDELRELGAAQVMMPIARAHPDAFRLLWRHAANEPAFRDLAELFAGYVTSFAREMLQPYLADEVLLRWAASSAGAHLIEGVCTWLDDGDPARDEQFATMIQAGLRSLAATWEAQSKVPVS